MQSDVVDLSIWFEPSVNEQRVSIFQNVVSLQFDIFNLYEFILSALESCLEPSVLNNIRNTHAICLEDSNPRNIKWLEGKRTLSYYVTEGCKKPIQLVYKNINRKLRIRTVADHSKTFFVEDNKTVGELMPFICDKMGIVNYSEYSLIHLAPAESDRMRTLTLTRSRGSVKDPFERLDKLKDKYHTDEKDNWIQHSLTFTQQGILDDDVLLLKRRYFYSDKNVSADDPFELDLLYTQVKKSIVNGEHPVKMEEAVLLAALQCFVEKGPPSKEKSSNWHIDLSLCLPEEYVKKKGIEKKIKETYKTLTDCKMDGRSRYVDKCRSLPSYGITFFLIEEISPNGKKLVPALFGNYQMRTQHMARINEMLSGYIDLILKVRQNAVPFIESVDDENATIEEIIEPGQLNEGADGTLRQVDARGAVTYTNTYQRPSLESVPSGATPGYMDENRIAYPEEMICQGGIIQKGHVSAMNYKNPDPAPHFVKLPAAKRTLVLRSIKTGLETIREAEESFSRNAQYSFGAPAEEASGNKRRMNESASTRKAKASRKISAVSRATTNISEQFYDSQNLSSDFEASFNDIAINYKEALRSIQELNSLRSTEINPEKRASNIQQTERLKDAVALLTNSLYTMLENAQASVSNGDVRRSLLL
ncbi:FERM central domain [Cichlidogyrus casuarinus]|uniref:FERM central domain n=1 Tax=Cichlidogyrus casuarinus TaxID=1844966 RepID=A0ABD2Q355_9PLAT